MKEICIKDGFIALVDDEDYERIAGYTWWVKVDGKTNYAGAVSRGRFKPYGAR